MTYATSSTSVLDNLMSNGWSAAAIAMALLIAGIWLHRQLIKAKDAAIARERQLLKDAEVARIASDSAWASTVQHLTEQLRTMNGRLR